MKLAIALFAALFSSTALADFSGHWWQPLEPGWGMAIQQQRNTAFVQLYTYDADGYPVWYVASCEVQKDVCSATLYETAGGKPLPYYAEPTSAAAGVMTLTFRTDTTADFQFKVGKNPAWVKEVVKLTF